MFRKLSSIVRRSRRILAVEALERRQLFAGDVLHSLPEGTTAAIYADHPQQIQPGKIVSFVSSVSSDAATETAFRIRSKSGEWSTSRSYANDGLWNWDTSGLAEGVYYVGTYVRAAGSTAAYQVAATSLTFVVSEVSPATGGAIETLSAHATRGETVRLTASGEGGSGNYEYEFRIRSSDGLWESVREYSTSPEWDWDTTEFQGNTYYVGAYVRDVGSPTNFDFSVVPIQIQLGNEQPLERVVLAASDQNATVAGTQVLFEALGIGGGDPSGYEYAFRMRGTGETWEIVQPFGKGSTWTWDTSNQELGEYYVGVLARRVGSKAAFEWSATPLTLRLTDTPLAFDLGTAPILPQSSGVLGTSYSTILVATCDSSDAAKQNAQFVGDCLGDQDEINAAIQALPAVGGTVRLAEGTYDIQAVLGTLGGIIVDRSNVILEGSGTSTKLLLADNQNTNVIRIIGDGLENITVSDLYINGNWDNNLVFDFEGNGIRADSTSATPLNGITVERTFIEDSARLNVFLRAQNAKVINNQFGDSRSDSVEILTGPGIISGNHVEIDGTTGYVFSTDQANDVTISNNTVHIAKTGRVTEAVIRTWGGRYSHIITGNQIRAEGPVRQMLEVNGYINIITGNIFLNYSTPTEALVNGASLIHDNIFHRTNIIVAPSANWSSSVSNNMLFFGSQILHQPQPGITAELFTFNNFSTSN